MLPYQYSFSQKPPCSLRNPLVGDISSLICLVIPPPPKAEHRNFSFLQRTCILYERIFPSYMSISRIDPLLRNSEKRSLAIWLVDAAWLGTRAFPLVGNMKYAILFSKRTHLRFGVYVCFAPSSVWWLFVWSFFSLQPFEFLLFGKGNTNFFPFCFSSQISHLMKICIYELYLLYIFSFPYAVGIQ